MFRSDISQSLGISSSFNYPSEVQEVGAHVQDCVNSSSVNTDRDIETGRTQAIEKKVSLVGLYNNTP